MILLIAAFALFLPQDPTDRLIESLSNPDIKVRDEATERLAALGPGIAPKLRALLTSDDADVVARVRSILDRLPPVFEKKIEVKTTGGFAVSPDGKALVHYPQPKVLVAISLPDGRELWKRAIDGSEARVPGWSAGGLYCETAPTRISSLDPLTGRNADPVSFKGMEDRVVPVRRVLRVLNSGDALLETTGDMAIYFKSRDRAYALPTRGGKGTMDENGSRIVTISNDGASSELMCFTGYGRWACQRPVKIEGCYDLMGASPDLDRLFIARDGGSEFVRLGPTGAPDPDGRIREKDANITALAVSRNARWLLVGDESAAVRVYATDTLKHLATIKGEFAVRHLEATPDYLCISDGTTLSVHARTRD